MDTTHEELDSSHDAKLSSEVMVSRDIIKCSRKGLILDDLNGLVEDEEGFVDVETSYHITKTLLAALHIRLRHHQGCGTARMDK